MTSQQTFVIPDPTPELQEIKAELAAIKELLEKVVLTPKPEWLPVKEYATLINRTQQTVMRMVEAGKLETKHIGNVRMIKV